MSQGAGRYIGRYGVGTEAMRTGHGDMRRVATIALAVMALCSGGACSAGTPKGTATGTVDITASAGGTPVHVTVGQDGQFTASLPPGTYTFVGHSPLYGDGIYPCPGPSDLVIGKAQTVNVKIGCEMQ